MDTFWGVILRQKIEVQNDESYEPIQRTFYNTV